MALIELYRTLATSDILDLAGYILQGDERAKFPEAPHHLHVQRHALYGAHQAGRPRRARHVRLLRSDRLLPRNRRSRLLEDADHPLGRSCRKHQMYITGGVGARAEGEAFGEAYELPNARAYGESCAAIGNMMWNWRMLAASGEARFADVIERALYNGINSGMSLDGTLYCYRNPLAFDPSGGDKSAIAGTTSPAVRRISSAPSPRCRDTSTAPAETAVYVHLYNDSELDWHLENGTGLKIAQKTNYPWDGR